MKAGDIDGASQNLTIDFRCDERTPPLSAGVLYLGMPSGSYSPVRKFIGIPRQPRSGSRVICALTMLSGKAAG